MQGMVTSSMGLLSKSIKPSILAAASMFTSYNWIYIISLPALSVEIDDFYQNQIEYYFLIRVDENEPRANLRVLWLEFYGESNVSS